MQLNASLRPGSWRALHDWTAEKLSRVTSTGELIPEIDGLRFLAIATVVFHHMVSMYVPASKRGPEIRSYQEWFTAAEQSWLVVPAYCGHFGVNLFFVISGFILALPFAKRAFEQRPAPGLKSYYLRRVTRIEPPYVISLLVYFFVHWEQSGVSVAVLPNLLASLLYSHGLIYGRESVINGVTWSLEVEIQFYLLVPFLVHIFRLRDARWRRTLLLLLIIGFGLLSQWVIYPSGSRRLPISLLNFLHYFLTGFLLADLYLTGWLRQAQKRLIWDGIALAAAAAIFAVLVKYGWFYFTLPLLVGVLYTGCFLGKLASAFVRWRWIVIIGGMCYTIYLYHILLIANIMPTTIQVASQTRAFNLDFALQFVLVIPVVLVICALLFVLTEKPFMRWSLSARPLPQPSTAD